jgi:nucleotide-binding universal stress UspA family protein
MLGQRILVPVDLEHNSFDALFFVQGLSYDFPIDATLLYVLNVNVVALERRVYDELQHEHEMRLQAVAKLFFDDAQMPRLCVRIGTPSEEILAEAESEMMELIVLSSVKPARRKWSFYSTTIEYVVRNAPCLTLVLPRTWKITPEQYRQATRPQNVSAVHAPKAEVPSWVH